MSDTDKLVLAVRDYLVAEWDARIAVINALGGGEPTLEELAFSTISETQATRDPTIPAYPALFVLTDRSRVEHWLARDLSADDLSHRVEIDVAVIDQDHETLQRKIWYYLEDVVWYLLKAGHGDDSIPWHIVGGEIEFEWGPILTSAAEQCFTDAKITVPFRR